jgi:beta-glucosidase
MVSHSHFTPMIKAKVISADKRNVETTDMNWEVYPESIYKILLKFSKYKKFKEIIITESGAAFPDQLVNGKVHDIKRTSFLEQYIDQVLRAKREGVNVNGYFAWSLTDNFEWAEGFKPRFGLVYIDFATQDRIIKDSGYWYSQLIQDQI